MNNEQKRSEPNRMWPRRRARVVEVRGAQTAGALSAWWRAQSRPNRERRERHAWFEALLDRLGDWALRVGPTWTALAVCVASLAVAGVLAGLAWALAGPALAAQPEGGSPSTTTMTTAIDSEELAAAMAEAGGAEGWVVRHGKVALDRKRGLLVLQLQIETVTDAAADGTWRGYE